MSESKTCKFAETIQKQEGTLLAEWMAKLSSSARRADLIGDSDLRSDSKELLHLLGVAAQKGDPRDISTVEWGPLRDLLTSIARTRAEKGISGADTAAFVLSLKRPLLEQMVRESGNDAPSLFEETLSASELVDRLALFTIEVSQKSREAVIVRQQDEMLELSTPVVKLWKGILALPMIGTLDSTRTQTVMETLLNRIVETGSEIVIIDITGVPTVDTLVAQHLLKTVAAARLMGVECIISGVRPQIAQTIVHIGIELGGVTTKATLEGAFRLALDRIGARVVRVKS